MLRARLEDADGAHVEENGVGLVEQRERAGRGEGRAADDLDGLGDAPRFFEDDGGEHVHGDAPDAVADVSEDVEVQGETGAVDAHLAEDAVLGQADEVMGATARLQRVPQSAQFDVPVPRLDAERARRTLAAGAVAHDRGAFARGHGGAASQDLRTGVQGGDPPLLDAGSAGDALDLGVGRGAEGPDRVEGALGVLSNLGGADAAEREEPVVHLDRGGDAVTESLAPGDTAVVRVGGGGLDVRAVFGAGDERRGHRFPSAQFVWSRTAPPTTVARTALSGCASGARPRGFVANTVRSARRPGAIFPSSSDAPAA